MKKKKKPKVLFYGVIKQLKTNSHKRSFRQVYVQRWVLTLPFKTFLKLFFAHSTGVVEYTDCISAEG